MFMDSFEKNIIEMAECSLKVITTPDIDKIDFQLCECTLLNVIEYFKNKNKAKKDNIL